MKEDFGPINILLTHDKALVFFEFLARFSNDHKGLEIQDQAEERVLWDLCCDLEKILVEPFCENYDELLEKARERVRDKND